MRPFFLAILLLAGAPRAGHAASHPGPHPTPAAAPAPTVRIWLGFAEVRVQPAAQPATRVAALLGRAVVGGLRLLAGPGAGGRP